MNRNLNWNACETLFDIRLDYLTQKQQMNWIGSFSHRNYGNALSIRIFIFQFKQEKYSVLQQKMDILLFQE